MHGLLLYLDKRHSSLKYNHHYVRIAIIYRHQHLVAGCSTGRREHQQRSHHQPSHPPMRRSWRWLRRDTIGSIYHRQHLPPIGCQATLGTRSGAERKQKTRRLRPSSHPHRPLEIRKWTRNRQLQLRHRPSMVASPDSWRWHQPERDRRRRVHRWQQCSQYLGRRGNAWSPHPPLGIVRQLQV